MDSVPDSKPVTPQPGLPKTIGTLNLIFGGMLFFCGLCGLNQLGPSLVQYQPIQIDPELAQATFEKMKKEAVDKLKAREQMASTEAEKANIQRERLALEAQDTKIQDQLDLKEVNRDLLWLSWYLWADVVTAPVLNLLMLASGIGLIQLMEWARKLALWVAALKLIRLVVLTVFLMVAVIPRVSNAMEAMAATDIGKALIQSALEQQNARQGRGAPPPINPRDLGPVLKAFGNVYAVLMLGLGAVYPALVLVALTRPVARAACLSARPDDEEPSPGARLE